MKRRDLLKTAVTFASTSFFTQWPGAIPVSGENIFPERSDDNIKGILHFGDGRDWFLNNRYGMFVHWGLYSIPGWHEQHQWRARVARTDYVKLADQWNPKKFNPEEWLDLMEDAGMKYITITTKHHDGFCLWDTKQTAFNTMNTPYKKDIIGLLSDACHKRKIPLCLYYSIVDWNQPNYLNQGRHHELPPQPQGSPDWDKYMAFLKEQVRELCTNYGEIHGFWWNMNVPVYKTDEDYYTDRHLIGSIDSYLARDANYLLNVGPTRDGNIHHEKEGLHMPGMS